jgi:hypothetical protein
MIYEEVIDTHFHYWDLSDPSLEYNFLNDIDDEIV